MGCGFGNPNCLPICNGPNDYNCHNPTTANAIIGGSAGVGILILLCIICCCCRCRNKKRARLAALADIANLANGHEQIEMGEVAVSTTTDTSASPAAPGAAPVVNTVALPVLPAASGAVAATLPEVPSLPTPPLPTPPAMAAALYPYTAATPDQISMTQGESFTILIETGDWWSVQNASGQKGLAPSNFLEKKTAVVPAPVPLPETPALPTLPVLR